MTQSERDNLVEKLQNDALLGGLNAETLAQMARHAIWREYAARVVIFSEGDAIPALYSDQRPGYLGGGSLLAHSS